MNWNKLPLILIFLSIFCLIAATLMFYLRHWASRNGGDLARLDIEGKYFKRYIPEQLRREYDNKKESLERTGRSMPRSLKAKLAATIVLFGVISIPVGSMVSNIDLFLMPIDLEPREVADLNYSQHQWRRDVDHELPELSGIIAKMSGRGLIIPFGKDDKEWFQNGISLNQISASQWENFAKKNKFGIVHCEWANLRSCHATHRDWIILALPGYWDFKALDAALNRGASIIVYGPPAQLFSDKTKRISQWQGLTFEEVLKKEGGEIILRGDQVLTLGFDAGLVVNAYSPFDGFVVFSEQPQAISFGSIYEAGGGGIETRLYAKTVGAGRLVWMDFSPDLKDQRNSNVTHLNAIMASIFRYLSRQTYSALAIWPQAKRFAAVLDEDTEDQFDNAAAVLEFAKRKSIPMSWYILSDEALKNRSLTRALSEVGEIACHGDHHGVFTKSNRRDQVVRIARCQKVLREITGKSPLAFRPPEEKYNSATIDAIINNGMTHYIADSSPDRAVPDIQVSLVSGKSLVSIPRMVNDDYEMWHNRGLNYKESIQLIDEEMGWMRYVGGIYMFSFHTQYIDAGDNLKAVEYLAGELKNLDAYFETSKTISEWWRFRADLQRGDGYTDESLVRFNPVMLSVNESGELLSTPYNPGHN